MRWMAFAALVAVASLAVSAGDLGLALGSACATGIAVLLFFFLRLEERSSLGRKIAAIWPLGRSSRSFDETQGDLAPDEIEYIHHIRNESHETEIVITVGLFAGLVSVDLTSLEGALWSLSTVFTPRLTGVLSTALITGIWLLRIGVFAHLLLRAIWIGLVGIGFAYPRGINRLRLVGPFQRRMYNHLTAPDTNVRLTLQMERICSLLYGVLICSVSSLIAWVAMVSISAMAHRGLANTWHRLAVDVGWDIDYTFFQIAAIITIAAFTFCTWSYLRVGKSSVLRALRNPLFEVLYFFKGTLLSQNKWTLPLTVFLPPACIAVGYLLPLGALAGQPAYVYLNEMESGFDVQSPSLPSALVDRSILHLQLPQRTVAAWVALADESCVQGMGTIDQYQYAKWARHSFAIWVDEIPVGKVDWIAKNTGDAVAISGFIPISAHANGAHILRIDPCGKWNPKRSIEIPFYLNLTKFYPTIE